MSDREFLIEANIQDVLKYIIADFDLSITDAMRQFYVSELGQVVSTILYHNISMERKYHIDTIRIKLLPDILNFDNLTAAFKSTT